MSIYLSVIIPAYKEATRIAPPLEKLFAYLAVQEYQSEVIVVDDGSPDATVSVAAAELERLKRSASNVEARVIELGRNLGKGAAVRAGMLAARGEIRLFSDADFSTPIYEVEKLLTAITKEGYHAAIGSRALEGSKLVKVHQPWYRETMGRVFNVFVQLFVFRGIKDTQCGFKAFRADAAEILFSRQKVMGFSFDVEILYLAKKLGYSVKEIAVEWYNDERTTVGALTDSTKMFMEILRIRRLHK